jgi:putative PIG3 family NAD(P)H quinone oxidoreductase
MRYVEAEKPGGPDVLRVAERETPHAGPGEVLIRVAFAGLNGADLHQRAGKYPPPPGASPVLGLEVSGEISMIGKGVTTWRAGDRVCALVPGGGYAEYCVAPAVHCLPIPKGLTLEQGAALPEVTFTVWTNVFEIGRLQPGETLLVHGGASGIGTTAIQIAKAFGSRVFTAAGSDQKCAFLRLLGADFAVNRRTHDWLAEVLAASDNKGVNVILDMVGGEYTQKNILALALDGRIVQISTLGGMKAEIDLREIMRRRAVLTGSHLRPRTVEEKGRIAKTVQEKLWPLYESGKVKPIIDRTFPLEEVADAQRLLENGSHIGKVLLRIAEL